MELGQLFHMGKGSSGSLIDPFFDLPLFEADSRAACPDGGNTAFFGLFIDGVGVDPEDRGNVLYGQQRVHSSIL